MTTTLTTAAAAGRLLHRPVETGAGVLGPRRPLHLPRHRRGVRRRLLRDGGARPAAAAARRRTSTRARTRPSTCSRARSSSCSARRRSLAGPGDFVNVPRGIVHCFRNTGTGTARMVLTFTPAGIEHWFAETLERAPNDVTPADVPDNVEEVAARYVEAAPRYGLEFVWPSPSRPCIEARTATGSSASWRSTGRVSNLARRHTAAWVDRTGVDGRDLTCPRRPPRRNSHGDPVHRLPLQDPQERRPGRVREGHRRRRLGPEEGRLHPQRPALRLPAPARRLHRTTRSRTCSSWRG